MQQYGSVRINLPTQVYLINQTIRGVIILDVHQVGYPGNTLFLKFIGIEDSVKMETRGADTHRYLETYTIKSKFLDENFLMYSFDGPLPITQMEFPFEIPLHFLHTTTLHLRDNQFYCDIKFYLNAYVNYLIPQKLQQVIKHKVPIFITRQFTPLMRPMNVQNTKVLKICCYYSRGHSSSKVSMPISDFMIGQQAQFQLEVHNITSQLDVIRIDITLLAKLEITYSDGSTGYKTFNHFNKIIKDGVKQGKNKVYDDFIDIAVAEWPQQHIQTSTASPSIVYKHYIRFELIYSGNHILLLDNLLCCQQSTQFDVPITIINQSGISANNNIVQIESQSSPELWDPIVQPLQQLIVRANNKMTLSYGQQIQISNTDCFDNYPHIQLLQQTNDPFH